MIGYGFPPFTHCLFNLLGDASARSGSTCANRMLRMKPAAAGLRYGRVGPGFLLSGHLLSHSNSFGFEMEKDAADNEAKGKEYREKFAKEKGVKTSSTGLVYQVVEAGKGEAPKDSDTVVVNYKGTLIDGKEFDNSYTRGEPLSFRLDGVIPGWTEGLKNIKKGGKIKLVIPPELAYGKAGVPGIPPNSTLVFDVELLDVKPAPKADAKPEADAKAADSAKK